MIIMRTIWYKRRTFLWTITSSLTFIQKAPTQGQAMLPKRQIQFIIVVLMTLCINVALMKGYPTVTMPPVNIPGMTGECPADNIRQASRELLLNSTRDIIRDISQVTSISHPCGTGSWRRVFHLNASTSDQLCPDQWNLVTSPQRGCVGADSTCRSAFSGDISTTYSKVCGRIIGEALVSPDAFIRFLSGQNTIEGNYLDGVSVTHGASGSRMHIWTFGAGHPASSHLVARCPCDNSNRNEAPLPPPEVGENYFCDRADELDRVWTGENCMDNNPCCSFHDPPYFSVPLPAATTDRIELRICSDQHQADETVLVTFAEIYVQ